MNGLSGPDHHGSAQRGTRRPVGTDEQPDNDETAAQTVITKLQWGVANVLPRNPA